MVSREHAAEIALADALEHKLGFGIIQVVRVEEIQGMLPIAYPVKLDGCWIAYVEQEFAGRLTQSTIILVDLETGKVVYRGGANDQGWGSPPTIWWSMAMTTFKVRPCNSGSLLPGLPATFKVRMPGGDLSLGQLVVDGKSNEFTESPMLLRQLDEKGATVCLMPCGDPYRFGSVPGGQAAPAE